MSDHQLERSLEAKRLVREYVEAHLPGGEDIPDYGVFVVWYAYVLGNWKTLVSTTLPDGMYYEVTYNRAEGVTYLDAYKKFEQQVFHDEAGVEEDV